MAFRQAIDEFGIGWNVAFDRLVVRIRLFDVLFRIALFLSGMGLVLLLSVPDEAGGVENHIVGILLHANLYVLGMVVVGAQFLESLLFMGR